jgi:thymidylate synthase (FAD)
MAYQFEEGDAEQYDLVRDALLSAYTESWTAYEFMLSEGIAKELAAFSLNTGIYSTAHVSMNPRSIMHFLSLRVKSEESRFPSNPQWEINQVADKMEVYFAKQWPLTHEAFVKHGRVAP